MNETLLQVVLPIMLALVLTNYKTTWVPIKKKIIDPLHRAGHKTFGTLSGKIPQIEERDSGHDLSIDKKGVKVVALLMGAPTPLVIGVAIAAASWTLPQNALAAAVLFIGAVLISGALNGLIDLSMTTSRGFFTDASLLETATGTDARKWAAATWLIGLALSALVVLPIAL